jgi:small conductance mechanosensitive channel
MTRWGLIILVAVTALQQVNFNLTAFVAGLGIAGFTIGFALKDISANFISGLLLLLQKPFAIGDVVQIDEFRGRVTDVSLRATEIETMDGHNLILPNETVYMSPILNYSRSRLSRIAVDVGVAYDTDLEHAEEVALSTVSALPLVLKDPEPSVTFHTFGDSSINFTIFYWIDNQTTSLFQASDLAVPALKRAFEEANIEIPFPVRTVYMPQAT